MEIKATPITEAAKAISLLDDLWNEIAKDVEGKNGTFMEEIFPSIWENGPSGPAQEKEMINESDPEIKNLWIMNAIFVSCAYAVDAMKAHLEKKDTAGWPEASHAAYWAGVAVGGYAVRRSGPSASQLAARGASQRHAENRAMKASVFEWLDKYRHEYKSMEDTAAVISREVVPIKHRTAREWITDWNKLRSSGKP